VQELYVRLLRKYGAVLWPHSDMLARLDRAIFRGDLDREALAAEEQRILGLEPAWWRWRKHILPQPDEDPHLDELEPMSSNLFRLSEKYRLAYNRLQWILQRRSLDRKTGEERWHGIKFYGGPKARDVLLRDLGELGIPVTYAAMSLVRSLPLSFRDWTPPVESSEGAEDTRQSALLLECLEQAA
jgi:hypothetical protein